MDSDFSQEELDYYDQEPTNESYNYYSNPNYTQPNGRGQNGHAAGNRFNFENHLHEHVKA